jgi:hypothetical protein
VSWLDVLGWSGSALLVWSMTHSDSRRLRRMNLVACVVLAVYNGLLHVWPMAALNVALTVINAWHLHFDDARPRTTPQSPLSD